MGYRNSFAPVSEGEVHDAGSFSRIVIAMRPSLFTIMFCALFGLLALSSLIVGLWPGAGMLVFLYLMVMGGFWLEANKQEQTLRNIFQAM